MYLKAILGYLLWPLMIILSYLVIGWALRKFESRVALEEASGEPAAETAGKEQSGKEQPEKEQFGKEQPVSR